MDFLGPVLWTCLACCGLVGSVVDFWGPVVDFLGPLLWTFRACCGLFLGPKKTPIAAPKSLQQAPTSPHQATGPPKVTNRPRQIPNTLAGTLVGVCWIFGALWPVGHSLGCVGDLLAPVGNFFGPQQISKRHPKVTNQERRFDRPPTVSGKPPLPLQVLDSWHDSDGGFYPTADTLCVDKCYFPRWRRSLTG